MAATLFAAVVISMLASSVYSYQMYQAQIPNGDRVPNPCDPSTKWMGVGHQNPMGGGDRNPFGIDFGANGHTWNQAICQKDSDGDGLSNGQELGDPNCTWSTGKSPALTMNITHPGICEPPHSIMCGFKNPWLKNCITSHFDCPAINDTGVKNYTMRFPPTPVPTNETTYICMKFVFPNDSDTDIIAIEPVIDNTDVVHHMLLFRCTSEEISAIRSSDPYVCGIESLLECNSMIGLWNFGNVGQCLNTQYGFRIGPSGYQHAILQVHWNNPLHKPNLMDSSGMRIYYTKKLRPNPGEIMMVGQESMDIPPGQNSVTFSGSCTASCTQAVMNQSVYIASTTFHMHVLGKHGIVRLYRNGQLIQVIEEETSYDYNMPILIEFETPIEVKPGDSIKVDCTYDSSHKNTTTHWGEATTSAEMCYGQMAYFPHIPGLIFCGQWKSIERCGSIEDLSDRCDLKTFLTYADYLPTFCPANCSDSKCTKALNAALMTGCQRDDDVRAFLQQYKSPVLDALTYCGLALPSASTPASRVSATLDANQMPSHCSLMKCYSGSIPLLAFVVYIRRLF